MSDAGWSAPRLVVVTGGPGAGKTAVLEVVRRQFQRHVTVLPEAASIVFGGGFPRRPGRYAVAAAQRAIYHVQEQLERLAVEEAAAPLVLCDRGTLDAMAYWPPEAGPFWVDVGGDQAAALARYAAVIHLRTPPEHQGYNHQNPLRIESAAEALALDERILRAWEGHPNRVVIASTSDFIEKLARAIAVLRELAPELPAPATAP